MTKGDDKRRDHANVGSIIGGGHALWRGRMGTIRHPQRKGLDHGRPGRKLGQPELGHDGQRRDETEQKWKRHVHIGR